jgi:peptidoglycan/LPS O-acetylase OafA/YrhL
VKRVAELDGLRGLAIAMVIAWHYFVFEASAAPFVHVKHLPFTLTWSGVDLFFVLSGFLIGGILVDARESPRYFRVFYARRAGRILPLYALVLAIAIALEAARPPRLAWLLDGSAPPWWVYALFAQNVWMAARALFGPQLLAVTWSLSVEEQFYLTMPLVVRACSRRMLVLVVGALVVAAPVLRAWLIARAELGAFTAYVLAPCRLDALGLGVLAACALREPSLAAAIAKRPRALAAASAVLAVAVLAVAARDPRLYSPAMMSFGLTLLALFYLSLILIVVSSPTGRLAGILRARPLVELGRLCYGLYLLHEPVLGACHGIVFGRAPLLADAEDFWITVLALLLTIVIARASWRWVEAPAIALGHRLRY